MSSKTLLTNSYVVALVFQFFLKYGFQCNLSYAFSYQPLILLNRTIIVQFTGKTMGQVHAHRSYLLHCVSFFETNKMGNYF